MSTSRLHPLKQKQIQNLTSPQDTPLSFLAQIFMVSKEAIFFFAARTDDCDYQSLLITVLEFFLEMLLITL